MYAFCVEEQKGLAYHLEDLCVPLVIRVPQFGNYWLKLIGSESLLQIDSIVSWRQTVKQDIAHAHSSLNWLCL